MKKFALAFLSLVMAFALMIPVKAATNVAKIGNVEYATLEDAVDAVESTSFSTHQAPETPTTITLLEDTNAGIDIGKSGVELKNVILDLNGHTLTLGPAVGSTGTETNGLRVLSYSKIEIKNGTITSNDMLNDAGGYVKFMLVNYGTMILDNIKVVPGNKVEGTINNRGDLTLKGNTEVPTAPVPFYGDVKFAITNDVYNAHYTNFDARLTVDSPNVKVGVVQVERYPTNRNGNEGAVVLDISAGTFDKVIDDGYEIVPVEGNVSGGTFSVPLDEIYYADQANVTVKLNEDVQKDVVIPAGATVTLDLNGQTLTNVTSDTITVEKGATLKVIGEGTVDNKSNGRAAVFNNGNVTLNGGTYDRTSESGESADISGGNSWYTICNHGTMTINKGVTVKNTGSFSSMIENGYYSYNSSNTRNGHNPSVNEANPSLNINGGEFVGGLNTVKNDDGGVLTIKDGNFTNTTQAAVLNWNKATIEGGYFETDAENCILNGASSMNSSKNNLGELTISGGTFNSNGITVLNYFTFTGDELINIKGGTYLSDGVADNSVTQYFPENSNLQVNPDTGEVGVFHTVTFVIDNEEKDVLVKENGLAEALEAPVKEGYTFVGWFNGDKEYDFNTPVTADITLTAKYEVTKYTVSFSDGVESQEVEHGKTAVKPADPKKEGYTFIGWYLGDEEYDFSTPVTSDLELTAKFEKNNVPVDPEKPADDNTTETPNTNGMSFVACYGMMFVLSGMILLVLAKKRSLNK
ncbi:InlB B-repeat-containing protein [Traorella massiliensis]|uniref:InlB B-repeat-containing protein n=1 Tax=Traorella massiliensis TaxID=1903263 RepID=UPI0008F9603B|nr:InlB B-repeat-containing protein [Traorella massiliensis]